MKDGLEWGCVVVDPRSSSDLTGLTAILRNVGITRILTPIVAAGCETVSIPGRSHTTARNTLLSQWLAGSGTAVVVLPTAEVEQQQAIEAVMAAVAAGADGATAVSPATFTAPAVRMLSWGHRAGRALGPRAMNRRAAAALHRLRAFTAIEPAARRRGLRWVDVTVGVGGQHD